MFLKNRLIKAVVYFEQNKEQCHLHNYSEISHPKMSIEYILNKIARKKSP